MILFLESNGRSFGADEAESVVVMPAVADGSMDETGLAPRIRNQLRS